MTQTYILSKIGTLFDGVQASSKSIHYGMDLHIQDGKIKKLAFHDPQLKKAQNIAVIDASKWFITPGLIDCHSHVTLNTVAAAELLNLNGPAGLIYVEKILYKTLIDGGVTTLRDMGGATAVIKKLVDDNVIIGPRLNIAICMLSTTGGHADYRDHDRCHGEVSRLFPPAPGRPSSLVDGPWACRKRVREIESHGGDFIKICAGRGFFARKGKRPTHQTPDFTFSEMKALCDEAHSRGFRVAAHGHDPQAIWRALEAGADDIQHATFMSEREIELAAKKGSTITPTSWVMSQFVSERGSEMVDPEETLVAHERSVKLALQAGIPILMGSDPILKNMHGKNYMEILHLNKEGLSPLQAWHSGTGMPASALGMSDIGTIEANRRADLLIFTQDVLSDPGKLENESLLEVIKDGNGYRGAIAEIPQKNFRTTLNAIH